MSEQLPQCEDSPVTGTEQVTGAAAAPERDEAACCEAVTRASQTRGGRAGLAAPACGTQAATTGSRWR